MLDARALAEPIHEGRRPMGASTKGTTACHQRLAFGAEVDEEAVCLDCFRLRKQCVLEDEHQTINIC